MIPYIITVSLFIIVTTILLHNFKKLKENFLTLNKNYVIYVGRIHDYISFATDENNNRTVSINGELTVRNTLTVAGNASIRNSNFTSNTIGNLGNENNIDINSYISGWYSPTQERVFQLPQSLEPEPPPIELIKEHEEPKRPLILQL